MKARVFGAGSIGNHLTYALRALSWDIEVVDIDPLALQRMQSSIYPSRYGNWDSSIKLLTEPSREHVDLTIIGTPPDTHLQVLESCLKDFPPSVYLVEKPFLSPLETSIGHVQSLLSATESRVFVGYNHSFSPAFKHFLDLLITDLDIQSVRSQWLESWDGIFAAHPWLSGPQDSYLGFSRRGGGALSEHSHGLHLLLCCMDALNANDWHLESFNASMSTCGMYDERCDLLIQDSLLPTSFFYSTDVLSKEASKSIEAFTHDSSLACIFGAENGKYDKVTLACNGNIKEYYYQRTRTLDFHHEISAFTTAISSNDFSPLDHVSWRKGLDITTIATHLPNL